MDLCLSDMLKGDFGGDEHVGIFLTSPEAGEKLVDESYIAEDINAAISALVRAFPERALPYMDTGGDLIDIDGNSYSSYGFSASEIIGKLVSTITTLSGIFFIKKTLWLHEWG